MNEQDQVVELRRYTLHPGARETLIDLFERELIEPQEAVGLHVLGQFRDLDAPDQFVWLRGFRDMAARGRGLREFYEGPVWARHKDAANATMIDSDDVLLLRPARPNSGVTRSADDRAGADGAARVRALVVIAVYPLAADPEADFLTFFEHEVAPPLTDTGSDLRAMYRTERSPNNFQSLPVREGEDVFVAVSSFRDELAYADHLARLQAAPQWSKRAGPALATRLTGQPHVARLVPTERSRFPAAVRP